MAEDIIDHYIDRNGIKQDTTYFIQQLNDVLDQINKTAEAGKNIRLAGSFTEVTKGAEQVKTAVTGLATSTNNLTTSAANFGKQASDNYKKLVQLRSALEENKRYQKALKDDYDAGELSLSEYNKAVENAARTQFKLKEQISLTTKEIKDQVKLQEISRNAPNSIKQAQAQTVVLTQQRNAADLGDPAKIAEINALIDRNNALIDANSDKLSKQKINIGNYPTAFTGAFSILNKELDQVNQKIASGAAGNELTELTLKQSALKNAVSLTGKEFSSTASQQGAFKEASKQLGSVYGTNSVLFKDFTKEVGNGNKAIKEVSKSVDAATGGTPKLVTGFKGLFSIMRNIANIIPGMGLGGLVLLMLAPLQSLATAFMSLFNSIDAGKIKVQALNEINEKAVDGYIKEKSKVEELSAVVRDHSISLDTRKEALKQLIEISPQYLNGLTLENIATEQGKKLLDDFILSLEKKAQLEATAAVNADANKTVENLKAEKQALVDMAKQGNISYNDLSETQKKFFDQTLAGKLTYGGSLFNYNVSAGKGIKQTFVIFDEEIKKATIKVKASTDIFKDKFKASLEGEGATKPVGIIQDLRDQIAKLDKDLPTLLTEPLIKANVAARKKLQEELDRLEGKEKHGRNVAQVMQSTKELVDAEFEIYKINQSRKIKLYEDDANNEKLSYEQRIIAIQDFYAASAELIDKEKDNEIKAENKKLDAINANLKKAKGTDRNNLLVDKKNTEAQLSIIDAKYTDKQIALTEKVSSIIQKNADKNVEVNKKENEEIYKAAVELQKQKAQFVNDKIDLNANTAALQIQLEYETKLRGTHGEKRQKLEKELAKKLEQIQNDSELQKTEYLIFQLQSRIAILKSFGINVTKLESDLAAAQLAASKNRAKKNKDDNDEELSDAVKLADNIYQLEQQAARAVSGINDAAYEKRKQRNQEQLDAIEKEKNLQLNALDKLSLSEEEKAKRTASINQTAAAKKAIIDQRQRADDERKARFDKAINIMNIILTTALNVVKATTPWGKAIAAATGAVELALAIATPIPKFRYGKTSANKYEGPGIWGEAGQREVRQSKDGRLEISPLGASMIDVKRDDVIFPSIDAMLNAVLMPKITPFKNSDKEVDMQGVIDAINNQPPATAYIMTKSGVQKITGKQAEINKWIERAIRL